jgi:hypothetical protein
MPEECGPGEAGSASSTHKIASQYSYSWRDLGLRQVDGAIAGPYDDGRSSAIHLPIDARRAKGAFDCNGDVEADVAVMGAGIYIGLQLARKLQIHAAVASVDVPGVLYLRAAIGPGSNATVAGLDVKGVKTTLNVDVAITS